MQVSTVKVLQECYCAAALVNPLIACESLNCMSHRSVACALNCGYMIWLDCLPVCMSEIAKETYSGQQCNLSAYIHIVW